MNDENEPLIRLVGVRKVFYTDEIETHALSDVHLEVHSGQFVEVMGPSGCGKSTLLAIVGLLDTPTEGEYWLEGRRFSSCPATSAPGYGTTPSGSYSRRSISLPT